MFIIAGRVVHVFFLYIVSITLALDHYSRRENHEIVVR